MSKFNNTPACFDYRVRYVHARRARLLRKRGESVRFAYLNENRKPVYMWEREVDQA